MVSYQGKGRSVAKPIANEKENDLRQIGKIQEKRRGRRDIKRWYTNRSRKKASRIIRRDGSSEKKQRIGNLKRRDQEMRMNRERSLISATESAS